MVVEVAYGLLEKVFCYRFILPTKGCDLNNKNGGSLIHTLNVTRMEMHDLHYNIHM